MCPRRTRLALAALFIAASSGCSEADAARGVFGKRTFVASGIAIDTGYPKTNTCTGGCDTLTTSSFTVPTGSFVVLPFMVAGSGQTAGAGITVSSTTTGLTFTRQTQLVSSGPDSNVAIFTAPAPSGGTGTVTLTWPNGTSRASAPVISYNGVDPSTPTGALATNDTEATPFSVSITPTYSNGLLVGPFMNGAANASTPNSTSLKLTTQHDTANGYEQTVFYNKNAPVASTAYSVGSTLNYDVGAVIELKAQ